jgi:hypothetical protein
VDQDPGPVDPLGQIDVVDLSGPRRERDEEVQPGRDALYPGLGQLLA